MQTIKNRAVSALFALLAVAATLFVYNAAAIKLQTLYKFILIVCGCTFFYVSAYFFSKTVSPGNAGRLLKIVCAVFFLSYVAYLLNLALFDAAFDRGGFRIPDYSPRELRRYYHTSVNLIPFKTIELYIGELRAGHVKAFMINIPGNIVAFMPLGFFIPMFWPKFDTAVRFTLAVVVFAVCIELTQLATFSGSCDIDDVILNALGAFLFYALMRIPPLRRTVRRLTWPGAFARR